MKGGRLLCGVPEPVLPTVTVCVCDPPESVVKLCVWAPSLLVLSLVCEKKGDAFAPACAAVTAAPLE
jgi:hypothetical protein